MAARIVAAEGPSAPANGISLSPQNAPAAEPVAILSTLTAIEDAINRDERGDALAILQNARDGLTAPEPVTPTLRQRVRAELDAAHLAIERLDQMLEVAMEALRAQGESDGFDAAVITCLENTVSAELVPAKDRIHEAMDLLREVSHG